jgi:hypothetical protein
VALLDARALRLAIGNLTGSLAPEHVQERVRARFPVAERLSRRPALDDLLASVDAHCTGTRPAAPMCPVPCQGR